MSGTSRKPYQYYSHGSDQTYRLLADFTLEKPQNSLTWDYFCTHSLGNTELNQRRLAILQCYIVRKHSNGHLAFLHRISATTRS